MKACAPPLIGYMQTAATSPNPLLTLLDLVESPLLLFNPEGKVVFTNRAAKSMEARPAMALPGDPSVRQLVQGIGQNNTSLRPDIVVDVNSDKGVSQLHCRCAPRPIGGMVAMAVSEVKTKSEAPVGTTEAPKPDRMSIQQIVALIGDELGEPIQRVLEMGLAEPEETKPTIIAPLHEAVLTLQKRLARLSDLVAVFGEDVLIGDERIVIPETVRAVCGELAPMAQTQGVKIIFEGLREDLPPVYGSEKLLRRALYECLENAIAHTRLPPGGQSAGIRVAFKASGHHLILNVTNLGVLSAQALSRYASSIFRLDPAAHTGNTDGVPAGMQIGLPLTHRILELHGGRLRIEDADDELNVMLELPTGAPLKNTHHLDLLQAQIYAEDLSKLMARGRNRSKA